MDRKFSRIENLWPRDGSCPLPLRSKSFPGNCFRIVKTQKISKRSLLMYGSHRLLRTKFLPLFCSGVDWKAGITFGRLMKFSRCVPRKEKDRPRSTGEGFCRVKRRQNDRVCCGAVRSFGGNHSLKVVVITVRTTTFHSKPTFQCIGNIVGLHIANMKFRLSQFLILR